MSQTWSMPLVGSTNTVSDLDDVLNPSLDALRTHFIGTADPASLVDGMVWANTTGAKLKHRAGGVTYECGDWGAEDWGFLRRNGNLPATANISMGGNRLTNVGAPSASGDAYRKSDADGILHGTTGHAHTGSAGQGPKIQAANLLGLPGFVFLASSVAIAAPVTWQTSDTYTTFDATSSVTPDVVTALLVHYTFQLTWTTQSTAGGHLQFLFRINGDTLPRVFVDEQHSMTVSSGTQTNGHLRSGVLLIPVDGGEAMEFCARQQTLTNATPFGSLYLIGYLTKAA